MKRQYKAKVFYQDFTMNVGQMFGKKISVRREDAVLVYDITLESDDVFSACERIFATMNNLNIPTGHPKRELFEQAGHTSMSVGDFIEFDSHDGIYFCASRGFVNLKGKELADAEAEATANELCDCGHPLSEHNNADSCSKFMECGCGCFEPKEK